MNDKIVKKIIRVFIAIFITILIATIIALLILKYNVEGENNMPFELSKIMLISNAEGIDLELENITKNRKLSIAQNNDIYLEISKNKNYKDVEIIDKIIIDNFKIEQAPIKGKIKIYRPTLTEGLTYENNEENEVKESLEYIGKEKTSIKNLEIANQGGLVLFRYSIEELGEYNTNSNEVKQDGALLKTVDVNYDELKCKVAFDLSIELKSGIIYTGTISLNLPAGNIIEEETSHYEITDLKDIIFKRNLR